ncbi:MAG: 3-phosphoshikimate 1-carboxyvinyltransferase [Brumimicrobium sp.]
MQQINPLKSVSGTLIVPSSKSYAQRAIAIASLCDTGTLLKNLTDCDDVIAAQNVVKTLGAEIKKDNRDLHFLKPILKKINRDHEINCAESGLSTRLFSGFSLLFDQKFKVTGTGSINNRTMEMVIDALQQFGKVVISEDGCLPLTISGKIKNYEIEIDGAVSSQLLTGLLIIAPVLEKDTVIHVHSLKSIPYIDMTIEILSDFGVEVKNKAYKAFYIKGNQTPKNKLYQIEGDWSGASFLIVAAALGGEIRLEGLNPKSKQADKKILEAITQFGSNYCWENDALIVKKNKNNAFVFDATHCPDLFPPLAVLAACAQGKSTIKGVSRLTHKESNRALTITEEFEKLGIEVHLNGDEMHIVGKGESTFVKGGTVSSRNDHRIAMALALFGLRTENPIFIEHPEAIDKSYPDFFKDFSKIVK